MSTTIKVTRNSAYAIIIVMLVIIKTSDWTATKVKANKKIEVAEYVTGSLPQGINKVTSADWEAINKVHNEWKHRVRKDKTGWTIDNHGTGLVATFDKRGVEVKPKKSVWRWGLELVEYGHDRNQNRIYGSPIGIIHKDSRLTYRWDGNIEEWYDNNNRGIEHGYTILKRLNNLPEGSGLSLRLRVRGNLQVIGSVKGQDLVFGKSNGEPLLKYSGLKVYDSTGLELPAEFKAANDSDILVQVQDNNAVYPLTIDPIITQQAYIKPSNSGLEDRFGSSVAVSGDTIVVGAPREDSNAIGINGDQSDNSITDSGAAYVFIKSGTGWIQQAYLKASQKISNGNFGTSIAISGDTIAINGIHQINGQFYGVVYIYKRVGTTWTAQGQITSSNHESGDNFGYSIAVSGDTIIVGAPLEDSIATGVDGNQSDNSALNSGAAYIFVRSGETWAQQSYLKASNTNADDLFGIDVAIDGDTAVIGAVNEDSKENSINGNQLDNTAADAGAAYVFTRMNTKWSQQAYLKASNTDANDQFGSSVGIFANTIVIGAPFETSPATGVNGNELTNTPRFAGAVYVFERTGATWSKSTYLKASNSINSPQFGWDVAIAKDSILVGAISDSSNAVGINGDPINRLASAAGAAYLFLRSGATWIQDAYLKPSNTDAGDSFGVNVGISDKYIIIGAHREDSIATGINGNQSDNSLTNSGAVYLYTISCKTIVVSAPELLTSSVGSSYIGNYGSSGGAGTISYSTTSTLPTGMTLGSNGLLSGTPSQIGSFPITVTAIDAYGCTGTVTVTLVITTAPNPIPEITSISPSSSLLNSSPFTLIVNGTNFVTGSEVRWNSTSRQTTYISSTKLTAVINISDLTTVGTVLVSVFNPLPGGGTSGAVSFTILAPNPLPQLSSISPATILQGGAGFTLSVNGKDFVDGALVRWNGQNKPTTYVSATQLTALINEADIASAGLITVSVVNPTPGGGVSNTLSITILSPNPAPTIVSIAPSVVQAGGGNIVLTVNGTNFVSTTKVEISGSERATSYISPTQLTSTLTSSDIQIPGLLQVSVRTPAPGGGTSATIPLTVAGQTPAATSLSPSIAIAGSPGFTLTITGNNFTAGSSVLINGTSRMATFVSSTQIAVMISSMDIVTAGMLAITIVNPFAPNSNVIELPIYNRVTSVSAASYAAGEQAPDSLIAAFGVGLATGVEINTASTLPTQLRGTKLVVKDSTGITRDQSLFFVAPGQINYHLHPATALGLAIITVYVDNRIVSVGELMVGRLAPAIFTQNATGDGVPAAYGLRVKGSAVTAVSILSYDNTMSKWVPEAIDLGPDGPDPDVVYLVLFGTGLRSNTGATSTMVKFNSTNAVPVYAGEAPGYVGLDQMNVVIPRSLIGAGLVNLEVIVDGKVANQSKVIQIRIK